MLKKEKNRQLVPRLSQISTHPCYHDNILLVKYFILLLFAILVQLNDGKLL